VTRNLLKRRIKESYRKNKYELIDFLINNKISCNVAFIYNAKDITNYKEIESKIILILQRLKKELASMNPSIQNFVNCK
jgi:ribonuclease P protein component